MTEEKQEELSMEDILSSIRSILMEDNVNQEEFKISTGKTRDLSIDEIESLNLDDEVLDLSAHMLVDDFEEPKKEEPAEDFDIIEEETKDVKLDLDDIESTTPSPSMGSLSEKDNDLSFSSARASEHLVEQGAIANEAKLDAEVGRGGGDNNESSISNLVIPTEVEESSQNDSFDSIDEATLEEILQSAEPDLTTPSPSTGSLSEKDNDLSFSSARASEHLVEQGAIANEAKLDAEVGRGGGDNNETTTVHDSETELLNNFAKVFSVSREAIKPADVKITNGTSLEDIAREEIVNRVDAWINANLERVVVSLVQNEINRLQARNKQ